MKCGPFFALFFLLIATACNGSTASGATYVAKTGNQRINDFVSDLQDRNLRALESKIARFETISGVSPQFKSTKEHLDWTEKCEITRVVQHGTDRDGNPVVIDPSLKSGPIAKHAGYVYWISWDCANGKFRQALNGDFAAPQILVSEMLSPTPKLPSMRPPASEE